MQYSRVGVRNRLRLGTFGKAIEGFFGRKDKHADDRIHELSYLEEAVWITFCDFVRSSKISFGPVHELDKGIS